MGLKIYNNMLHRMKTINNFNKFKKEVKLILLKNSSSTLQEFYSFKGLQKYALKTVLIVQHDRTLYKLKYCFYIVYTVFILYFLWMCK
jgi:hypothetical protein